MTVDSCLDTRSIWLKWYLEAGGVDRGVEPDGNLSPTMRNGLVNVTRHVSTVEMR